MEGLKSIELPKNWAIAKLSDMVIDPKNDFVDGPFGSNLKANEYKNEGVPVFRIQNIKAGYFLDKNIRYVTKQKAEQIKRHSFKLGDIIITKLGEPLGLCCKVPAKYPYGIIVADLMRVRSSNIIINSDYLVYAINSKIIQDQFKRITKGTTRSRVNLTIVRDIEIPLAPLNEQNRIVEKLDELLSEIDKGKEHLQTSLVLLKNYRKAILHSAIEGKYLEGQYKWYEKTFGEIISISSGNGLTKANRDDEGEFLVYGGNGVAGNHKEFMFKDKQLIIGRVGAYCGNAHITKPKSWVTDNAFVATFDKEKFDIRFLYHLIWYLDLNKYASSTAQPVISQGKLYPIQIRIPEIDAQIEIVKFIESQYLYCEHTENSIIQNLSQSDSLKQSLLKKAFEGELLEQAPNDEPASLLLERIKKERMDYLNTEKGKKQNQKKTMKKKSAVEVAEFPLADTIKDKFGNKSFTFEQLKSKVEIKYDDLREELFSLLDNERVLTMEFSKTKGIMNFKFIGK